MRFYFFCTLSRYAYHLRRWALEGKGVGSHAALSDRSSTLVRLVIQPAGMSERCVLDLLSSDYIADLRAEVVTWWEKLCQVIFFRVKIVSCALIWNYYRTKMRRMKVQQIIVRFFRKVWFELLHRDKS